MIFRVTGDTRDHLIRFPKSPEPLCGSKMTPKPLSGFKPMCKTCLKVAAAHPELLSENPGERAPLLAGIGH